jgi:ferritin-like metal-binding protein YciE
VPDPTVLNEQVVRQLQAAHVLKAGALHMFDPMLAAVAAARDGEGMDEVTDLLGRMHGVFSLHREVTAGHAAKLAALLRGRGAGPSRGRLAAMSAGAMARARLGGENYGASARDAFVFEHLEIATLHLLEQLAERAQDPETAGLARACRAADEEMAATINRNWTNVLSLTLAARGLPTLRPPEEPDGA